MSGLAHEQMALLLREVRPELQLQGTLAHGAKVIMVFYSGK